MLEHRWEDGLVIPHLAARVVVKGEEVLLNLRCGIIGCYHVGKDYEVSLVTLLD